MPLYANVGAELTHYDTDIDAATLTERGTVTLPAAVQYAWPHVSRRFSTSRPAAAFGDGPAGNEHHVTAFRIDRQRRAKPHGEPIALPSRPIHMATDIPSRIFLVAFNNPSALRVYRINSDLTPGEEVKPGPIDPGIFAHQVRVTPDNQLAILVTRGNDEERRKAEATGRAKSVRLPERRADQRSVDRAERRISDSARGISIFIRRNRGSMSRWNGRMRWRCSAAVTASFRLHRCSKGPRWASRSCSTSLSAPCTCIRMADLST